MNKPAALAQARAIPARLRPMIGRQIAVFGLVGLLIWVAHEKLPALDLNEAVVSLTRIQPGQWVLAALATAGSFWAVGRYDQVVHGLLGTAVDPLRARRTGTVAIATAQFAGFGVLSGALVRWRLLPELSLGAALRVSFAVSVSFLAGWAVVAAAAVLVGGSASANVRFIAVAVLALAAAGCALLYLAPGRRFEWPTVRAWGAIIGLALADTLMAAAAFHFLMPKEVLVPAGVFVPAFLVALGAGLVGGTPGGIGPFEIALVSLLPSAPPDALLGSALAFRIVYYALPAAIALVILCRPPARPATRPGPDLAPPGPAPYLPPGQEALVWSAPRSEFGLLRQGELGLLKSGGQDLALAAPVGQHLVMVTDPLDMRKAGLSRALLALRSLSQARMRPPLIYKCSARPAAVARAHGWKTVPIAEEAWLDPTRFTTDGRARRQLRRHLRKAEKSGVRVIEGGRCLPLNAMQEIADHWARAHGGERGFSMGRFQRDYVSCQRVFLAYLGDELIAFSTFHEARQEWTLDLMRHGPSIPDGTMQMLVVQAIRSAAAMRCRRLSLAAVPHRGGQDAPILSVLRRIISEKSGAAGLRRFKTSFAPRWQPLYAAAPTWRALVFGLLGVAWRARPRRRHAHEVSLSL